MTDSWPAGGIAATLLSPFGPAIGTRVVGWARGLPIVGPVVCWVFPTDQSDPATERLEAALDRETERLDSLEQLVGELNAEVRLLRTTSWTITPTPPPPPPGPPHQHLRSYSS